MFDTPLTEPHSVAMAPLLAHFTGIPHHSEEVQSIATLWPLVILALQLVWIIVKRRTRQVVQAVLQGLREARPFFLSVLLLVVIYVIMGSAQAAPAVVLRGPSAQVLGSIEIVSSGRQELRDSKRSLLGTYSSSTNQTRDASGRLVGTGNLLTSLLR